MSTSKCCEQSPFYTLRRYDPIGRTMWVRDWFHGYSGEIFNNEFPFYECRMCILNDVIYVSGPLVWENEDREGTWWNLAAYTVNGQMLWRTFLSAGHGKTGVFDVATVNGKLYALVQSTVVETGFGETALIEFDSSGRVVSSQDAGRFVLRLCVANQNQTYGGLPTGIVGYSPPGIHIEGLATAVTYQPDDDDFTIGAWPWMSAGTNTVLFRATSIDSRYVTTDWAIPGVRWGMTDGPNYFGHLGKSFIDSYDLALAPDNGTMHVSARGFMVQWTDVGGNRIEPTPLGNGTLVRLDAAGNPLWFRSTAVKSCLATDEARLYVGTGFSSPTIGRWTFDGELIWAHHHYNINQIKIIDDRGIVTTGVRAKYGYRTERHWIGELV